MADDMTIAALPFYEAQALLVAAPDPSTRVLASLEWYAAGPDGDPNRGSFAMVNDSGPFAGLVGERVLIVFGARSVLAYVLKTDALDEDIAVTRRLFMALAPLDTTSVQVAVTVLV